MRGDSGVADEGKVVGVPKFIPGRGKCTMPLTNVNPDWMSNTSSGLCVIREYSEGIVKSIFECTQFHNYMQRVGPVGPSSGIQC